MKAGVLCGRLWLGRIALVVFLPSCALIALELTLRGVGYGEDASYFRPASDGARSVIASHPTFTRRFLPPGMDRVPMPVAVDAQKPAGVCRVVVLGSSAALGDPEPAFGIGRHLDVLLSERFPGTRFEVINTGLTAVNSHVVREIAADLDDVSPDLVIVYTGNNEVVGPYGPGSALTSWEPPLWVIRARTLVLSTRTGQLVRDVAGRVSGDDGARAWQGMKMFLDRRVADDDPRLARVRAHFAANLSAVIDASRAAGAAVVVTSLPANLLDCAPFASRSVLTGEKLAAWRRAIAAGDSALASGATNEALRSWDRALALDGSEAALRFRRGRALVALGRAAEGAEELRRALELDTLRFRADAATDLLTGTSVARAPGPDIAFADIRKGLEQASLNGLPGADLLLDHVHLTFRGNHLAARIVLDAAEPLLSARGLRAEGGYLDETATARRLAYTSWDERGILEQMLKRKKEPPFTNQHGHEGEMAALEGRIARLSSAPDTVLMPAWQAAYRAALDSRPRDPYLLERLAALLIASGDPRGAVSLLERQLEVWPGYENAAVNLALALAQSGRPDAAEARLRAAFRQDPGSVVVVETLADFLLVHGRIEEAAAVLREGIAYDPPFFGPYYRLARLLATTSDMRVRNGKDAIRYAEIAVRRTQGTNLVVQEILAAAYAADEEYDRAAAIQLRILDAARTQGLTEALPKIQARLDRYRSRQGVMEN